MRQFRGMWLSMLGLLPLAALILTACGEPAFPSASESSPTVICQGGGGCWEPAPSAVLVVPTCEENGVCGEGVAVADRFYGLLCFGVTPEAVLTNTLGTGEGVFTEARPIRGLPPELWLAVRGDLPCRPGQDQPLEHEWYLLAYHDVSIEQQQEYGPTVSDVLLAP